MNLASVNNGLYTVITVNTILSLPDNWKFQTLRNYALNFKQGPQNLTKEYQTALTERHLDGWN